MATCHVQEMSCPPRLGSCGDMESHGAIALLNRQTVRILRLGVIQSNALHRGNHLAAHSDTMIPSCLLPRCGCPLHNINSQ